MKGNLHMASGAALLRRLRRWSGHPAAEKAMQCLAAFAAGLVLAGVSVARTWLPLPICLAAALGLGLPSFSAYVGGCVGYLVLGDPSLVLEPVAVGLLVEACLCIFGDTIHRKNGWAGAAVVVVFTALVGFLFLLEQRFAARMVWRGLLRITVGGVGTLCCVRAVWHGDRLCRTVLGALACGGLCAVAPGGIPLGAVGAGALAAAAAGSTAALPAAVLCGLALDLCWGESAAAAVFALAALVSVQGQRLLRLVVWLGTVTLGVLVTDTSSLLLAAAIPGALLSLLLPAERLFDQPPEACAGDRRMEVASELLDQLRQCLEPVRRNRADPETAAVFDQAAERICRMCGRWDDCWEENVMVTVDALERAAPAMMTRGKALREDLPQLFAERCCHLEGFLTAINRELEDLRCRRQCRSRIRESRLILAGQYGVLARSLRRETEEREIRCRFLPEVGFRTRGRMEDTVSGDRGATFRQGRFFYLILCDGMGTGPGAAAEAGAAISILRSLLQTGAEPREAMEFLNGIYILREDGGFATVDLLRADLHAGEAELVKWGAAPSYLKHNLAVEKLGSTDLPPGIGVGEEFAPEQIKLSMTKGETLILISDGADGERTEQFLRQYGSLSPRELADGIVGSSSARDDDCTAAVIALRPRVPAAR